MNLKVSKRGIWFVIYAAVMLVPTYFESSFTNLLDNAFFIWAMLIVLRNRIIPNRFICAFSLYYIYLTVITFISGTDMADIHLIISVAKMVVFLCVLDFQINYSEIKSTKLVFKSNNILYGKLRPNLNKVWLADRNGICSTDIFVLTIKENDNPIFYANYLRTEKFNIEVLHGLKGAQLPRVGWEYFSKIKIPKPSVELQNTIAEDITMINVALCTNEKLIDIFEQKIKDLIDKVWGE